MSATGLARGLFRVALCECGGVLCDGVFTGVVRVKCRGCQRRVWVICDGRRLATSLVDTPPRELVHSKVAADLTTE